MQMEVPHILGLPAECYMGIIVMWVMKTKLCCFLLLIMMMVQNIMLQMIMMMTPMMMFCGTSTCVVVVPAANIGPPSSAHTLPLKTLHRGSR